MFDGFDQILADFVEEADELLDSAIDDILDLEQECDQETINKIFRVMHTMKGNASMLGFENTANFAHMFEDSFSSIRAGKKELDKSTINLFLASLDGIKEALIQMKELSSDEYNYESLKLRLNKWQSEGGEIATSDTSVDGKQVVTDVKEEKNVAGVKLSNFEGRAPSLNHKQEIKPKAEVQKISSVSTSSKITEQEIIFESEFRSLVVDDDFVARQILSSYLSQLGPSDVAKDGKEAIEAIAASFMSEGQPKYQLVCLDIMMPVMDGLEVARMIRDMERMNGVDSIESEAVIFMTTALDNDKTIMKALYECGANNYFVKPISLQDIKVQLLKAGLLRPIKES